MKSRLLTAIIALIQCLTLAALTELPIDSALRMGTLPNGMTYYIRHNAQPAQRAECWMAHKVGSIVEEDNEQGLAHLLEHMAFNGTTHFPGQSLIHYLTASGMTYGGDINASTSFDETLYHISNIPISSLQPLDSVLLIMRDLSGNLTLDSAAIEKEKNIVGEEWRSRNDYVMRIYEKALPALLGNSRYAHRIPIGLMDVVNGVNRQQLMDFYKKWFRPDLQAIVVVGDFDAAAIEKRIKEIFSTIPTRKDTPRLIDNQVCADGIKSFIYQDIESPQTTIHVYFPFEKMKRSHRNTLDYLHANTLHRLISDMFNLRLNELMQNSLCPLQDATCSSGDLLVASTIGAFTLMGLPKAEHSQQAFTALLTEARRVQQHGFTDSELQRAIELERTVFNKLLNEIDNHSTSDYVAEYIDHFINGGYIPGVKKECDLVFNTLDNVHLNEVNALASAMFNFKNLRVLIAGTHKESLPDQDAIYSIVNNVACSSTDAYIDIPTTNAPLMSTTPAPGRIIDEHLDSQTGITTLTLSNGAKVQLKHTTFQNDEILFNATSPGGCWAYGGRHDKELRLMNHVVENSALGSWTQAELQKRLATTPLSLVYEISDVTDDINGNCQRNDLATLLQLNYLYFTSVKPDTAAYSILADRLKSQLGNMTSTPEGIFADSIASTLYSHHPLFRTLTPSDIDSTNFSKILKLYDERVACINDFTFSIVGNFDSTAVRSLIEQYIASIPNRGMKDTPTHSSPYPTGDIDNVFLSHMSAPKGSVYAGMLGDMPYNLRNIVLMDITGQVMQVALTSYLREELHGTYGVDAAGALSQSSHKWMISAKFDTQPERTQSMVQALAQAFDIVLSFGTTAELLDVIKTQLLKQHDTDVHTNTYWLGTMRNLAQGIDTHTTYHDLVKSIDISTLNNFITHLTPTARIRVIMQGY